MILEFTGPLWFWKGPAPFHFITVPEDESVELKASASLVTYGWGMIPVTVHIGDTEWTTSLFPKDGLYVVPIKDKARRAEDLQLGELVLVRLSVAI